MMSWPCGAVVLLLCTATAAGAPARITVTGDACELSALVDAVAATGPADSVAAVSVTRLGAPISATVVVEEGSRTVSASTCAELAEAVALVLDMALAPPPPPPRAASGPARSRPALRLVDSTAPAPPPDLDLLVAAIGTVSSHGWRQGLALGTRWRRAQRSLGLELRVDTPDDRQYQVTAAVRVWTGATLALIPCMHAGAFAGCAVASVGAMVGWGDGLTDNRHALSPVVGGGLRAEWEHRLSRLFLLHVHLEVDGYATRTVFEVDHMPVWTSDRGSVWGAIGYGATF